MKNLKGYSSVFLVVIGVVVGFLLFRNCNDTRKDESMMVISYELERMNKLIVAEEKFAEYYTHESSVFNEYFDEYFSVDDKKIILLVTATSQVTYDMTKMDVELDSTAKVIRIKSIPEPELKVFPDVKIYDIDQGLLNSFDTKDLQEVMKNAKENITQTAQKSKVKEQADSMLIENLQDLYMLAKIYNWKIENETKHTIITR